MQINHAYQTPRLTTAMVGPLHLLEKQILARQEDIERWFQAQWQLTRAPVYGSVDLRNAGFKLAPVDMNLFPAGFNNLNPAFFPLAIDAAEIAITQVSPSAKRILLIPENHTRNLFYWKNIAALLRILASAGYDVKIGSLLPDLIEPREFEVEGSDTIVLHPMTRKGDRLELVEQNFDPDLILLNNDLSENIPDILKQVSQPVVPPPELGWNQRLKSAHFQHYANVTDEFAKMIEIDPWFIAPLFRHCGEMDFMHREGEEGLMEYASQLFSDIEKKYAEYQIASNPFIIVKADAGTYGMAVMTVRSVDELRLLNRKQRTHMSKSKGGQSVHRVIIQEGVYTFETIGADSAVAEPVIYLWGQRVVGGFYRVHKDRGIDENLNAPGMHFEPLAFEKPCHQPAFQDECQNRFYAYGVVARLSMLAAAREMQEKQA